MQVTNVARFAVVSLDRIYDYDLFVASDSVQQSQTTDARFGKSHVMPLAVCRYRMHHVNAHPVVGQNGIAQSQYQRCQSNDPLEKADR